MIVIKPPHQIMNSTNSNFSVFLAGSIEMGNAEDWQSFVTNYFRENERTFVEYGEEILIFNPRRDDWDSSWKQEFTNPQFFQQVTWELNALEKSSLIIMYFDPNTKSPISLLELGLFAESGKLLVCCPEGFWRKGNVDIVCEKYGVPIFNSLDELLTYIKFIL